MTDKNGRENCCAALLYTTIDTIDNAQILVKLALEAKLAACANIIPGGQSIYLWNDTIEQNSECYILFKTTMKNMNALQQLMTDHHPYDTPAILICDVQTSQNFFDYLQGSMGSMS